MYFISLPTSAVVELRQLETMLRVQIIYCYATKSVL